MWKYKEKIIPNNIKKSNNIISQQQLESDYQLGKQLQKVGYIETDWKVAPINLYGEIILREYQ